MSLNKDQARAAKFVSKWWKCSSSYLVIDAKGGTGKTYLVNYILPLLSNCTPLLLTPTNESLKQLVDKLDSPWEYTIKTVHSALGITPIASGKDLVFKQGKLPDLWEKHNLAVIDEASMIGAEMLELLIDIGIKILWIGHSSQLPPIEKKRKRTDSCESPVFMQGWETISLTIPMRNSGELWDFNTLVEQMIYDPKLQLPCSYDISRSNLATYLESEQGKEDLLTGMLKVAMWSNAGVDTYNKKIRRSIHGAKADTNKYLKGDLIILTKPYSMVEDLPKYRESGLISLMRDTDAVISLYSNTKAVVIGSSIVEVNLNSDIKVQCYKIKVLCNEEINFIYELVDPEIIDYIASYYEHIAWSKKVKAARDKVYKERHFILSCFAQVKHYFAATSHRLQGASIPKIIVMYNDILKNINRVERHKCLYVATSRSIDSLMVYRGHSH